MTRMMCGVTSDDRRRRRWRRPGKPVDAFADGGGGAVFPLAAAGTTSGPRRHGTEYVSTITAYVDTDAQRL